MQRLGFQWAQRLAHQLQKRRKVQRSVSDWASLMVQSWEQHLASRMELRLGFQTGHPTICELLGRQELQKVQRKERSKERWKEPWKEKWMATPMEPRKEPQR